jgi:hypothetical protein
MTGLVGRLRRRVMDEFGEPEFGETEEEHEAREREAAQRPEPEQEPSHRAARIADRERGEERGDVEEEDER